MKRTERRPSAENRQIGPQKACMIQGNSPTVQQQDGCAENKITVA